MSLILAAPVKDKIKCCATSHLLTVQTNHGIKAYVESSAFSLKPLRQQRILIMLTQPHVTYVKDRANMGEQRKMIPPHNCVLEVEKEIK